MTGRKRQIGIGIAIVVSLGVIMFAAAGANAQHEPSTSVTSDVASNNKNKSIDSNVSAANRSTNINPEAVSTTQAASLFTDVDQLISAYQCTSCHSSNYDNFKNPDLIFKHDPHLARGVRCAVCHSEIPHKPGITVKPTMDTCFSCHGVSHQQLGMVATGSCMLCHPPGFKRLPKDHSKQFKEKTHKRSALKNSFPCVACHGNSFCFKCHAQKKVLPKDHGRVEQQKVVWKKQHGKERDMDKCSFCHDDKSCTSCHETQMPHPVLWLGVHKDPGKTNRDDCKTCHEAKKECSECHHQFEITTILTQKTCERCHEDYKPKLQTLLARPKPQRNAGIIIHKAHFEMGKTDPYECSECHERDYAQAKGCFSFELCYECHGRERGGSLIAKWGGQELCYRCHKMK